MSIYKNLKVNKLTLTNSMGAVCWLKWVHLQNPVCLPKDEREPIEKELHINNAS